MTSKNNERFKILYDSIDFNELKSNINNYDYLAVTVDSIEYKKDKITDFALCIILYKKNKGGHILYRKIRYNNLFNTLQERLRQEVNFLIDLLFELEEHNIITIQEIKRKLQVHYDINSNKKYPSNKMESYAKNYTMAIGINESQIKFKPYANMAKVADFILKSELF